MVAASEARPVRGARGVLVAALVLATLVAVVLGDVLFGGRTLSPAPWVPGVVPAGPVREPLPLPPPALRDLEGGAWVDEPAPYLLHAELAAGRLPLWNDAVGLGAPLAANPNMAAWSPLQLVVNLAPGPALQDLAWVLRVWLLAVSTWALARALGCGPLGALAAAAALALSGQTLDWLVHHPLNVDVFVPLALAAALQVLRGSLRAGVVLAVAVAAGLLGVKPQSALVASAFGTLVLLAATFDERGRRDGASAARIGGLAVPAIIGVLLAGIALVPFLEIHGAASGLVHAGRSTQSEWTRPASTIGGLAGPWALRLTAGPEAAALAGPPRAGLVVLALAVAGAWRARRRAVGWVLAATVVLYVARIFGFLPVRLAGVPVLGSISYVKYCFPLYLALALLAGLALDPVAGGERRRGRRARAAALAGLCAVVAELAWLGIVPRPPRLDPYAPAPWVESLRALDAATPGRASGPVALAPPLVSGVLGLRDLRAIDVLTPRVGYEFVSQLVAPSEGLTWILADPDPLAAATAPGAAVADLRWILSRDDLAAERLPAVARTAATARRLARLFATLDGYAIDSESFGAGMHEHGGDRRFHWTCRTPCRLAFRLAEVPPSFALGLAADEPAEVVVRASLRGGGVERHTGATLALGGGRGWRDVWLRSTGAVRDAEGRREPGDGGDLPEAGAQVVAEITSATPVAVFVGGIGPSPGPEVEEAEARDELAFRIAARDRLVPRHADGIARIFENPDALGAAYLATQVGRAEDLDDVRRCLVAHPRTAVACVADPALVPPAPADQPPGTLRIEHGSPSSLAISVDAARDALLVVSRLDFPGWRATVDAKETAIVRVHGAMMGVVVPAGRHRVELTYRPSSLLIGALASVVGLAALLARMRGLRRARGSVPDRTTPRFEGPRGRG
ncbi:MAG: YfhO family protein [Deltaproteobacteria bacterium]|nr:YfhO family protein [Deltaproteobacteria bacterium]